MAGRPKKKRTIRQNPRVFKFSPRGIRGRPDEIVVSIDEVEAIRLGDLNGHSHKDAARLMNISRQTFERILKRARGLVAEAIVHGKIVKIEHNNSCCLSRDTNS